MTKKLNIKTLTYPLLVVALFLVRYWDTIFQDKIIGNAKDSIHLIGPVFRKVNQIMLEGYQPLWIQEILSGVPFFNNAMFSLTYPFYFLGVIDIGDDIQILRSITLIIVFHLFLLFISNIILLRTIGYSKLISIIAGFSIILCLNTAYNATWVIAIGGYALMPLFFAGVIQIFKENDRYLGITYLAIASLSFLAKPAQTAILAIVFGGILVLIHLYVHRQRLMSILPKLVIAGVLIIGINLPGLVQLFLDFNGMMRFTPNGPVTGNAKIPVDSFRSEINLNQTINYLLYYKQRIGVGHPWTGPMTLFSFFMYCFIRRDVSRDVRYLIDTFFAFIISTVIIAFGKSLPTFWIHYHTPLLGKIRESTRFLFITNIGWSVMLATLLAVIQHSDKQKRNTYMIGSFIVISYVTLILQCWHTTRQDILLTSLPLLGMILTGLHFFKTKNKFNTLVIAVLIVSIGFSILLPNARYGKREHSGWDLPENVQMRKTLSAIKNQLHLTDAYRMVYHDDIIKDGEWANAAMLKGIRSLQGNTVCMPVNQFDDLWHQDNNLNYRDLWGGKWHLYANDKAGQAPPKLEQIYSNKHHTLFQSKAALPRVWVAARTAAFDGDIKKFRRKLDKQKRATRIAYLPTDVKDKSTFLSDYTNDRVDEELKITYVPNQLSVVTEDIPRQRLVVINEYYSDHWKPTIDGVKTQLINVNVNQMGLIVPAGLHHITLSYQPYPYIIFRWIQRICFGVLIVLLCMTLVRYYQSKAL